MSMFEEIEKRNRAFIAADRPWIRDETGHLVEHRAALDRELLLIELRLMDNLLQLLSQQCDSLRSAKSFGAEIEDILAGRRPSPTEDAEGGAA